MFGISSLDGLRFDDATISGIKRSLEHLVEGAHEMIVEYLKSVNDGEKEGENDRRTYDSSRERDRFSRG